MRTTRRRWVVHRTLRFERWRVLVKLRVYHGFGLPQFEFEFRLGRPRRVKQPEWIEYEQPLEIEDGYGI